MKSWIKPWLDRRVGVVLIMGVSSGLPLALTGSTLNFWQRLEGVSLREIGLFGLVQLAYLLKFLWAPLLDHFTLPYMGRGLGRRRSWMILVNSGLIICLLLLGASQPQITPLYTVLAAIGVAFFSASLDMVIDAYRVELLPADKQSQGVTATQYGYQFGMLIAGAGALTLSVFLSWFWVYATMAAISFIGMVFMFFCPEPKLVIKISSQKVITLWGSIRDSVVDPFASFMKRQNWLLILLMIVLFKLGDAVAGRMANLFFVDMGFAREEIASVSKGFGLIATLLGVAAGAVLVQRVGLARALFIAGILQAVSTLSYLLLVDSGHVISLMALSVFIENGTSGIGAAAMVTYLSRLCDLQHTATQYALLSALASVGRILVGSLSGFMAESLGWSGFFIAATLLAVPGLLLLFWHFRREILGLKAIQI
ncbi:MAG: MFS transporter [Candidatus Pacebacteria bacterium]|nr:MFS transporter [Candidatus Paceibacterota bacterium]